MATAVDVENFPRNVVVLYEKDDGPDNVFRRLGALQQGAVDCLFFLRSSGN